MRDHSMGGPACSTSCLRSSSGTSSPAGRTSASTGSAARICSSAAPLAASARSEEHTSELQSLRHLVCRLLLEKKKKTNKEHEDEDVENSNQLTAVQCRYTRRNGLNEC